MTAKTPRTPRKSPKEIHLSSISASSLAFWASWRLILCLVLCCGGLGLGPADIVLVVNQNSPDSVKLAKIYAAARGIPDGRTVALDLPATEEVDFDVYERDVVPPIRDFLRSPQLQGKIRCLVTFYGVPFRIRAKTDTDAEKAELADLQEQLRVTMNRLDGLVSEEETQAKSLDPTFVRAPRSQEITAATEMATRHVAAINCIASKVNAMADPQVRHQYMRQLDVFLVNVGGAGELLQRLGQPVLADPNKTGEVRRRWEDLREQVLAAEQQIEHEEARRYDADARAIVRELTAQTFGPLKLAEILESQIDYLKPGTTNAALDNELALLWFNYYPRNGFLPNPLNFHRASRVPPPPMLMVSRLDGPDPVTVEAMIATSVKVESQGLSGCLALNSFGYPNHLGPDGRNAYKEFDRNIRDLGRIVRTRTSMELHEEYSRLYLNREIKNTALYCGWYSLRHYVPGMQFSPGAVGYHVASLEMVGLHESYETGWVRGLTSDGVVATLGPVAEPYLIAFPPPDEFFPLLMTGKMTLAEVYWRTEPTTSWMMCLVGDPLYNPYKFNAPLKIDDLPPALESAITLSNGNVDSSGKP